MILRRFLILCGLLLVAAGFGGAASAQSTSSSYMVNEYSFGTGGELNACSTSYCSRQSAGETTVGNTSSTNYQAQGGFNTSDVPLLELNVNGGLNDLGVLDSATTKKGAATFTIRNYLSSGYVVRLAGSAPINGPGGHTLTPMASAAASSAGTEQFGVNLVANSSPSVGASPAQIPDSTFGFGAAAAGYNTPNQFKFVNNDVVASSPKSSGQTLFTLSIIANVSTQTPAGQYGGSLSVIVIPTF